MIDDVIAVSVFVDFLDSCSPMLTILSSISSLFLL